MAKYKHFFQIAGFLCVLLVCLKLVSDVFQVKASDNRYAPFFEQEEDYDVLFLGTSHMFNGVYPMELWDDYGITSYNLASPMSQIATSYWTLMNALDYTTPRLVVVDVYQVGNNAKTTTHTEYVHTSFDAFPTSITKIKGIYDLYDDPTFVDDAGECPYDYKWEFIWDFGKYHSRWGELLYNDILNEYKNIEKGAESGFEVADPDEFEVLAQSEVLEQTDIIGFQYLRKIIEECHSRNIEVLLTYNPYPASEAEQRAANSVYAVAEEYGVNYLNFVAMDSVVTYQTDCMDSSSHLNASGAKKVTSYLGEYIKEHYDIPDRREDAAYSSWQDDYATYFAYKTQKIAEMESLDSELMLLADQDFSFCLVIGEDSAIYQDDKKCALLDNLSLGDEELNYEEAAQGGQPYVLIVDHVSGLRWESTDGGALQADAAWGRLLSENGGDDLTLYANDGSETSLCGNQDAENSGTDNSDVRIYIIENDSGEVLTSSEWNT